MRPDVIVRDFKSLSLLALLLSVPQPAAAQVGSEARDAAAAENAVTPPKLSKFAQAAYPAEAQAKGIEAEVVLALDIDANGKVSVAEVVEPAGHGFDEAARAAALQFEFEPARRNGRPVKSRILYRYAFRFEARPEPAQPAPSSISGRVLAASGEMAVVGAVVRLERRLPGQRPKTTSEPLSGQRPETSSVERELVAERVTGADGKFDFPDLPAGDYRLSISAEGLLPFASDETLQREERLVATFRLE